MHKVALTQEAADSRVVVASAGLGADCSLHAPALADPACVMSTTAVSARPQETTSIARTNLFIRMLYARRPQSGVGRSTYVSAQVIHAAVSDRQKSGKNVQTMTDQKVPVMPSVSRSIGAAPDEVFAQLADGWIYGAWVVGASHIRDVDAEWPAVGAL